MNQGSDRWHEFRLLRNTCRIATLSVTPKHYTVAFSPAGKMTPAHRRFMMGGVWHTPPDMYFRYSHYSTIAPPPGESTMPRVKRRPNAAFAAALVSAAVGLVASSAVAVEKRPLKPPVYLPDGSQFRTWEQPLHFDCTLYVDPSHPQAADDNPGTQDLPLRTINRAAQLARPGQRVVVAGGVYRERVSPVRGGTGPTKMISYEAAPGAEVRVKGSRILKAQWIPTEAVVEQAQQPDPVPLWTTPLPNKLFPDYNPFAEQNLTDARIDRCMPWAVGTKGKVPGTLRRGLVFQDGHRLLQVAARKQLAEAPGRSAGTPGTSTALCCRFGHRSTPTLGCSNGRSTSRCPRGRRCPGCCATTSSSRAKRSKPCRARFCDCVSRASLPSIRSVD